MNNIKLIKQLVDEPVVKIVPLNEGITNKNFLVNDKYVVRIKENKERFYSFSNEKKSIENIEKFKLSEKVIYLDEKGNKISNYIKDLKAISYRNNEIIKVARMLKKLHSVKIKISHNFEPIERYKYYKASSKKKSFIHEKYIVNEFKKIYEKNPLVFSHNDVVKNNILFSKNKSYLIDYEYAGKNIYLFDLASFISENNLSDKKKIKLFLDEYGLPKNKYNDLTIVIIFENLLWYFWAIDRYKATKNSIYRDISKEKRDKIKNDIKYLKNNKIIS